MQDSISDRGILTSRRSFASGVAALVLGGCVSRAQSESSARLRSRPHNSEASIEPGAHPLGLRSERDAILYVPGSAQLKQPAPLLVYLHGAGGPRPQETQRMQAAADDHGFILLSPASEDATWDAIRGNYGSDVRTIDEALARTFAKLPVDPKRLALAGFSDGASYGLGLGLSNGDFFPSVLAFSPGFIPIGTKPSGKPKVFVSHGTNDTILPIDSCSRRLVPMMKQQGLNVTYREFDGPHTVPRDILADAARWFLGA